MKILVDISGFYIKFHNKLVSILYYLNIKKTYLLSWIIFSKRDGKMIGIKSFCPLFHPFAIASVPLVLFSFFFPFFFFFLRFSFTYYLYYLWHALSIDIFPCLYCISLLHHLIITRLEIDFIITMSLTYVLGNYYDLYKYH